MTRRLALVADALVTPGGAEKVFAVMCEAFPDADVFTSRCLPQALPPGLAGRAIRELVDPAMFPDERSLKTRYPLAAWQMGRHDFSGYDTILASSAHLARYISPGRARFLCYSYYPFRLLYEPERYTELRGARRLAFAAARPLLRAWDQRVARRVDRFIAISEASRAAIRRHYGRDADVIPSPILNLPARLEPAVRGDHFLVVSRLERWKLIDVVIRAFAELPGLRLVVVGDGPERPALEAMATPNVHFAGRAPEAELERLYRTARALIHPTPTEYGLTPIEANAYGTPAICVGVGGCLETMVPWPAADGAASALFFDAPEPGAVRDAVRRFEQLSFDPSACFRNAQRFGREPFVAALRDYVTRHGG
ncbi:MAG: glycosyltransferase [Gemmatimonadales bacterium]|nr:glycosyltransferase [Gemmatimonadales bacterium]